MHVQMVFLVRSVVLDIIQLDPLAPFVQIIVIHVLMAPRAQNAAQDSIYTMANVILLVPQKLRL